MKKTIKILCAAMLMTMVLVPLAAGATCVATPYTQLGSFDELAAAFPGVTLIDAPEGATEVAYLQYTAGLLFAEIDFTLDGDEYCFRALAAENEKAADKNEHDLSGVYIDFDEDVDEEDVREGEKTPFAVPASFAFEFEVEYNRNDGAVNMEWYLPEAKTQYNLFSQTAGMPDMKLLGVAEKLLPVAKP